MPNFLTHIHLSIQSGILIPVLVLLPNLFWMILPVARPKSGAGRPKSGAGRPKSGAGKPEAPSGEPLPLTILENIGRAASLLIPPFYSLQFNRSLSIPVAIAMILALLVYYACWVRYFTRGRQPELLKAPFLGIPLPMALAPILFLFLSAYLLASWWMLAAALLFGIAHIWVSAISL